MSGYLVRDVMTRSVVTLSPDDTLLDAYKLMQRYNLNRVVAVDEEYRPVGILTSKDLVGFLLEDAGGRALDDVRLTEAMTKNLIVVSPSYSVPEAASLMLRKGISSLIVVDEDRRLVGIVTKTDMCRFYSQFEGLHSVKEYMSSPVVTIRPHDSVFKAALMMVTKNISRLVVVEGGRVVGIITMTDLTLVVPLLRGLRRVPRRALRPLFAKGLPVVVADLMTSDPITVHEDEDLAHAARVMVAQSISGLPVLDASDELAGIVTKTDVVRAVSDMG
ncbi:MAG: histidine kinase [Thermoprotei archaeon]|nr:MAG: histidine kinase [Thermoprotei archaeon]